jgi:hypothetical protein
MHTIGESVMRFLMDRPGCWNSQLWTFDGLRARHYRRGAMDDNKSSDSSRNDQSAQRLIRTANCLCEPGWLSLPEKAP